MSKQVVEKQVILKPNGDIRAVDYTGAINLLPRNFGLIGSLGLFRERFGTQKNFFVARKVEEIGGIMEDRNWETTRPTIGRSGEEGVSFKIPHFPLDDMILPSDVDGRFVLDELQAGTELDSVARVRAEKMARLRRYHANTHELARAISLQTGDVFAPNGTLKTSYGSTINVYNEWGITRQSHAVRTGAGVDPLASFTELVGKLQDAAYTGDPISGWVVLASPELFKAVTENDYVREIYATAQLVGRQDLLVGRLPSGYNLDARYRTFNYGGVTLLEVRDTMINGQRLVPANQGIALPLMSDLGTMHFAPANKFADINGVSQASYFWEYLGERDDKLEIQTETNFATTLDRPDLVFTVTFDATPAA